MLKAIFTRILASVLLPLMVLLVPAGSASTSTSASVPAAEWQAAPAADFEALLNLNYCYGTSFSDEAIAMGTLLSLLELAGEEDGFRYLETAQADYFTQAFYGRTVDFAACGLEVENGRVWIPAMGYDMYTHTVISAEENGEQVKVLSKVVCDGHDGETFDALCTSVFVKNTESPFGYHLLSSEILA